MAINDKRKRHREFVKCSIALKPITHGSTHRLCSTTKNLLLGYKESVHSCAYEPNSILQLITRQEKWIRIKTDRF